jgi:hypothetical protein
MYKYLGLLPHARGYNDSDGLDDVLALPDRAGNDLISY